MRIDICSRSARDRQPSLFSLPAAFFFLWALVPVHTLTDTGQEVGDRRTVRLRIAIDEEYRMLPGQSNLAVKKTVAAAGRFFKKHFGLSLEIQEIVRWRSDNTRWTLEALCDDLYGKVDRGDCDVVIGFSGQIRGESKVYGVASYDQGYILVKRSLNSHISKTVLTHELCHVFGAVDLEQELSIMNKDRPQFECDDFTRQIVDLHRNRRFGPGVFPLSPEDQESAISLYEKRKALRRQEAGLALRLAAIYLERRESEKAIKECLEAERMAPLDPTIRTFLELAYRQKAKAGSDRPPSLLL